MFWKTSVKPALVLFCSLLWTAPATAQNPDSFPTHHDTIPNFAKNPTIESARNGPWSSASTWSPARLPQAGDIVLLKHDVSYDSVSGIASVIGIANTARLKFRADQSTRLQVGTLLVMPGGSLEIGTEQSPVQPQYLSEVVIRNLPLSVTGDPDQYGIGILSIDGRVVMHGSVKTPTFVRLGLAPRAGDTTLTLEQPVSGWTAGDKVFVPDSRQVPTENGDRTSFAQLEVRLIQSVSPDGRAIAFSPALQFNHPGTTDEDGDGRPDYLPHAGNVTRNILIHSESRAGTRGHVLFTNRSAVDVRYAAFEGLGRTTFQDLSGTTNHIGRYSLHMHHLFGPNPPVDPQYQFRLVGNSVYEDTPTAPPQKWGITVHGTHYGLIQDNVVFNIAGAGIVTEDGSESFNVFDHNFVAKVTSNGGRDEHADSTRGIAREGVGFWFRGPNNSVRNNVAANMGESVGDVEASYGFKFNMVYLGSVAIPNFRGADTMASGEYTIRNGNAMRLLEFQGNEMYGQIQGLTLWWLCSVDYTAQTCDQSVLRDTVIWHASRYAYYGYPASNYVFDNMRVYGDPAVLGTAHEFKSVFWYGDYGTGQHLIINSAFYNTTGVTTPYFRNGPIQVENSYFKTLSGIVHRKSAAPGSCSGCDLPDGDSTLRDNLFAATAGRALRSITLSNSQVTDAANNDRLYVCNHNGQSGDNFQVFFPQYGNPPCTTSRADISGGYACVTSAANLLCGGTPPGDTQAPSVPTGLSASAVSASRIDLSWTASTDNVGVTGYKVFRGVAQVGTTASTSYNDTGLTASTTYSYTIAAYDAAGNTSAPSASRSATTFPPAGGGTFLDDFNRPDSTLPGSQWQQKEGGFHVANGELRNNAGIKVSSAIVGGLSGADMTAAASFASTSNNGSPSLGIILRYQGPGNYYYLYRQAGGSSLLRISRIFNGKETVLKQVAISNPGQNVFFRLGAQITGNVLSLSIDGAQKAQITDNTFATGGAGVMVRTMSGNTNLQHSHRIDNVSVTAF